MEVQIFHFPKRKVSWCEALNLAAVQYVSLTTCVRYQDTVSFN
jgi:hypothetical protein